MDVDEDEETTVSSPKTVNFIRYLLLHRVVEEREFIKIVKKVFGNAGTADSITRFVDDLNDTLDSSKLKIRSSTCEVTSKKYYVLISTHYRPDSVWPSHFNDAELEFIKNVIHEIIKSENKVFSSIDCLNLDGKLDGSNRERIIHSLIADKWLVEPKKGRITLSALSICELRPYLKHHYSNEITQCSFCRRDIYYGKCCSNCNALGHRACITKYLATSKKLKCPSCHQDFVSASTSSAHSESELME